MKEKKQVILHIGGKDFSVTGSESTEVFAAIEKELNSRLESVRKKTALYPMEEDRQQMLMAINLADDYLKAKETIKAMKNEHRKLVRERNAFEKALNQYKENAAGTQVELEE